MNIYHIYTHKGRDKKKVYPVSVEAKAHSKNAEKHFTRPSISRNQAQRQILQCSHARATTMTSVDTIHSEGPLPLQLDKIEISTFFFKPQRHDMILGLAILP